MYKDKQGYIWIGTQRGLFLYDGVKLSLFSPNKPGQRKIPDSEIRSIGEDIEGNLLVATFDAHVLKWDQHQKTFVALLDSRKMNSTFLFSMVPSKLGYIWLNTDSHIGMYTTHGSEIARWIDTKEERLEAGRPTMIREDSKGNLIVGRSNSYSIINPHDATIKTVRIKNENLRHKYQITAIDEIDSHSLLVGTDAGDLLLLEKKTGYVKRFYQLDPKALLVTDFLKVNDKILVGTDQGLYLAAKNLSNVIDISDFGEGLSSRDVYSLYQYGSYKLIGTSHGLNMLTFTPFTLVNAKNSLIDSEVNNFAEDVRGNIWLGSFNGLFRIGQKQKRNSRNNLQVPMERISDTLTDQRIMAISSNESLIWAGFYKGGVQSIRIGPEKRIKRTESYIKDVSVIDLETGAESETVWVATFQDGLIRIEDGVVTEFLKNGMLKERTVTFLKMLRSNNVLLGCLDSIYIYNQSIEEIARLDFSMPKQRLFFYSALELQSGEILFGTKNNGLFIWDTRIEQNESNYLVRFNHGGDLKKSTIYGIQQDQTGDIWLSTNRGIVKLDADGNFIRRFTMADGLQGMDFTFNSSFQSSDGRIFFGGPGGYNVFRPEEVSTQVDPPKTKLTSVRFSSDSLDNIFLTGESSTVRLTHKDKFVTFEFSIMEFVNTGDSQFRYMLENYDTDWIDNGHSHKATYTNLPTGNYRFRVQGMNSAGIWDTSGDSIALSVLPPPWFSVWAYVVYSIGFLLLMWAAHRVYHSYVVERRAAALAREMFEAEERAEDDRQEQIEYQDELIQSAYQHKMDTLNLLSTFVFEEGERQSGSVSEEGLSGARKRVHILAILENHIYYQADGPAANLRSFADAITPMLLDYSPVDPDTVVIINGITESLTPTAIASPLAIIIYELLENCIQNAFDPDSPANYIILNLEKGASKGTSLPQYTLTVNDDGIGAPVDILKTTYPGRGLYVVQAIVRELEGHIEISTEQGTRIVVSLVEPE